MSILQWLHGLERLGHRVTCIDYIDQSSEPTVSALERIVSEWWHPAQSALIVRNTVQSVSGLSAEQVARIALHADVLIDLDVPMTREPFPMLEQVPVKVVVDRDPVLTQTWVVDDGLDVADVYGEQDHYFTFGANIGSSRCSVPDLGISWLFTWNPVIMDWWSPPTVVARDRFTTVGSWWEGGYHMVGGQTVGPKCEQWRKFIDLPRQVGEELEIALDIEPDDADVAYLKEHGWRLESPRVVAGSPALYRDYVMDSAGEFSCAKGLYAETRCGWFSDRSTCYLAAGRPVVVQATGFEDVLPTGRGLFAVRTVEEAREAIQSIRLDYAMHSSAARDLALEYFDSDRLLSRLLSQVGVTGASD